MHGVAPGEYRLIVSREVEADGCDVSAIRAQFAEAGHKVTIREDTKNAAHVGLARPVGE